MQNVHCIIYGTYFADVMCNNGYVNPNMEIINPSDYSWILAYLCLVTVPLSSTSKTYVK